MLSSAHDLLFKHTFGVRENAAAALRLLLPEALAAALDWEELRLVSGSFVDEDLRAHLTDLLFHAPGTRGETLVYVLFEHQSTVDKGMALRLLRYRVRIWTHWAAEHDGPLPVILPVVLYHGRAPWAASTRFEDLIEPHAPELAPFVPRCEFRLADLRSVDLEALRDRSAAFLTLQLFRHATGADIVSRLREWADVFRQLVAAEDGLIAFGVMIRYLFEVSPGVSTQDMQQLFRAEVGPRAGETVMTVAEQLIEKGLIRGRQEGHQNVLLKVLSVRFGAAVDASVRARLAAMSTSELEEATGRLLSAESLEAFFGESGR